MRVLAVVAFAMCMACGGGNKKVESTAPTPDQIPKTAGPDCGAVADHLMTLAEHDPVKGPDKAMGAKINEHCKVDAWTDEARSCFATASTDAEAEGCVKLLSDSQQKVFTKVAKQSASEPAAVHSDATAAPPKDAPKAPTPKGTTRGATKKDKPTRTGDPCQGGE